MIPALSEIIPPWLMGHGKNDVIVMDGSGAFTSVRERAAFELSCPGDSIE
jgi:hypothetical protein